MSKLAHEAFSDIIKENAQMKQSLVIQKRRYGVITKHRAELINQIDDILKNTCNWLGVTTEGMCVGCERYDEDEGICSANDTGEAMEQIKELINKGAI
jgi:hypothetical protein